MELKQDLEARVAELEAQVKALRELLKRVGIVEGPFAEEEFGDYLAKVSAKRNPLGIV